MQGDTPVLYSLGNFIFSGLQTRNQAAVLVGCVASALLAIVLDQLIRALETGLRERRRSLVRLAGGGLAALSLYAFAAFASDALEGGQRPITIGSKTFTEQYILADLLAARVEQETGLPTHRLASLGSTVAFDAMTVHGGPANRSGGRRRGYTVRYAGPDMTYYEGPGTSPFLHDPDLAHGDPIAGPRYPVVFGR